MYRTLLSLHIKKMVVHKRDSKEGLCNVFNSLLKPAFNYLRVSPANEQYVL